MRWIGGNLKFNSSEPLLTKNLLIATGGPYRSCHREKGADIRAHHWLPWWSSSYLRDLGNANLQWGHVGQVTLRLLDVSHLWTHVPEDCTVEQGTSLQGRRFPAQQPGSRWCARQHPGLSTGTPGGAPAGDSNLCLPHPSHAYLLLTFLPPFFFPALTGYSFSLSTASFKFFSSCRISSST